MGDGITLSVLICTYNRHELLQRALESVVRGTQEKPDQVVVVNGGDERADRVVQSFLRPGRAPLNLAVKLVKTVNRNLAVSRNIGLAHCTGDVIAMTDDDAEVFPDWVTRMKDAHRAHPEAGAVGGVVIGTNTDSLVGKLSDVVTFPTWPEACYVRTLPGVNVSYKRAVLERIGPQDEALFRGEDVDYNWRVQRLGYKVFFDPQIKVYHYHRPTLRAFMRQHHMYGRAYYLVRRKWPDMYCVYPRELRRPRDFAKAVHFVVAPLYQPVLGAWKLPRTADRLAAVPLLFATGMAWRAGVLVQKWREARRR